MNIRLLAHIFNDLDLKGSELEGIAYTETVKFITEFLSCASQKNIEDLGDDQDILSEESQEISKLFKLFYTIEGLKNPLLNEMIKTYRREKRLLLPGGWRGSEGHAMVYEFRQDEKTKKHLFLVWNTGAGIDFHSSSMSEHGRLYSPVRVYQFQYNDETKGHFKDFLIALLKPRKDKNSFFEEKKLYQSVLTNIIFLNGKEVDPTPYFNEKATPQFSGTCGYRVLEKLIENYGFKNIPFEVVQYEIQRLRIEKTETK